MKFKNYLLSISWLWIAALLAIWFSIFLGNRPFATPDEGRYVEIPREMVSTGNYITPRLNGVKYFEKPPLFYWIQAINIKTFGLQEWAMRLATVLFAVLGCLGTYLFGCRFYGHKTGIAACLILATTPLYYALSRLIILDMPVTTLLSLSMFSFLFAVHTPKGLNRRLWAWGFYGLSALAVLTKGLMALAISAPVILIWALSTGRWKDLWPAYIPTGIVVFLTIAAPWHILASLQNPEFAHKYFVVEHFLRYLTSVHMRSQPFYFFVPVLILGLFPWISLLGKAIQTSLKSRDNEEQKGISQFLLIWAAWTFGFFSISNSKLIPYILPCFAPLALILGNYWTQIYQPQSLNNHRKAIYSFAISSFLFATAGLATLWLVPSLIDHRPHLIMDFSILFASFIILTLLSLLFMYRGRSKLALSTIPLSAVILIFAVIRITPDLQRPSIKPLAQMIQSMKAPGDKVGSYRIYYQDLPVYTDQIVTVVDMQGELEFGCQAEDCTQWMVDEPKFLELWKQSHRFFIIARSSEIQDLVNRDPSFTYLLHGSNQGNVLITNR